MPENKGLHFKTLYLSGISIALSRDYGHSDDVNY